MRNLIDIIAMILVMTGFKMMSDERFDQMLGWALEGREK